MEVLINTLIASVCFGLLSQWQIIRQLLDNKQQNEFSVASFLFFLQCSGSRISRK